MKILRKALAASTPNTEHSACPPLGGSGDGSPDHPLNMPASKRVLTGALRRVKILFPPSGVNVVIIYQLTVQCGEP